MPKTDSIEGLSSQEVKERLMQTSLPETGEEESQEEEVVATEETETEETKPEETAEAETEKEVESKEEVTDKRYKIKVEGKEEELSIPEMVKYAQQGRYLEKEKARLNAERKKLREESGAKPATQPQMDFKQLNDWFMKEVEGNPVGTIFNVMDWKDKMNRETERGEKKKDREYELELSEEHGVLWKQLKPKYDEFRDLGYSREESEAKAQADFWKDVASKALQTGTQAGVKKTKMKQMAEIPSGTKKLKSSGTEFPSLKDASKMTSAELKKYLKYTKNPEW